MSLERLRAYVTETADEEPEDGEELSEEEVLEQASQRIKDGDLLVAEEEERFWGPTYFDDNKDGPAPPPPGPGPGPQPKKTTWIEFKVIDDLTGEPLNWVRLTVKTPDGNESFQTTNSEGLIRIDDIDPGTCDVRSDAKPTDADMGTTAGFVGDGDSASKKGYPKDQTPPKPTSTLHIFKVDEHKVKTGDTMDTVGQSASLGSGDVAKFNWNATTPEQINAGMRDYVGSTKQDDAGNYKFDDSDKPGIVLLPSAWEESGLATEQRHTFRVKRYVPPPVLRVNLQFFYNDPEKKEKKFPEKVPLKLVYDDNSEKALTTDKNGAVKALIDRGKKWFKIVFDFSGGKYMCWADPDASTLIAEADVDKANDDKKLVFRLPEKFSTVESDWTLTGPGKYEKGQFKDLPDTGWAAGDEGTPAKMVLDPHWKAIRFEYFDRYYGHSDHGNKRISIPRILLSGWRAEPSGGAKPDTHSNWTIQDADNDKACQCLPWILQHKDADGSDLPKLNKDMFLQFGKEKLWAFSKSATEREIKTLEPTADELKPKADRLKYYDLPKLWKSKKYYARTSPTTGKFFQDLTEDEIKAADDVTKPLVFSLDDIIFTKDDLTAITMGATDRAAIFYHTFDNTGTDTSTVGLYKPDAGSKKSYFSTTDVTSKYYVTEYPNWTRLIVAQGNLFDVFDQRTEDGKAEAVGARAGVRWVDAVSISPSQAVLNPRPARTDKPFISIRPFEEQRYSNGLQPYNGVQDYGIGRFEMCFLRCCGHDGDNELCVNFHYFRFFFNFNNTPPPGPGPFPASIYHDPNPATAQANRDQYMEDCCTNIPNRWNGNDTENGTRTELLPRKDTDKIKGTVVFFVQPAPSAATAHYFLDVVRPGAGQLGGRDWMQGRDGTGEFGETSQNSQASGWFTAAHETGHGDGLPDEYNERWNAQSFDEASIRYNVPGDPYEPDGRNESATDNDSGMMTGVRKIRNRYLWHGAEFARAATNIKFKVKYGVYEDFWVPAHANWPNRSHVYWPANTNVGATSGRGAYDLFLYTLGKDRYSQDLLASPNGPFDGLLVVCVKMAFALYTNVDNDIKLIVPKLSQAVRTNFNNKWYATGTVAVNGENWEFKKCLIQFSPRFLVYYNTSVPLTAAQTTHNTRATNLAGTLGTPFTVLVNNVAAPNPRWNAASPDRTLRLEFTTAPNWPSAAAPVAWDVQLADNFAPKFCAMLGLAENVAGIQPNDLLPMVQTVITTNAAVAAI